MQAGVVDRGGPGEPGDGAGRRAQGHLFVVSAPSGAGKTSLIAALVERDPSLAVSISHTTRVRRPAETDGVHYHFVAPRAFDAMRRQGAFLEWADVFGHAYGTARAGVLDAVNAGRDVILEIDWQGAAQVRRSWPRAASIFVLPPSRAALAERLNARGQDRPEVIARRTRQAVADMSHHGEFDHLVVNDDFDATVRELERIVAATRRGETLAGGDHAPLLRELLSGA